MRKASWVNRVGIAAAYVLFGNIRDTWDVVVVPPERKVDAGEWDGKLWDPPTGDWAVKKFGEATLCIGADGELPVINPPLGDGWDINPAGDGFILGRLGGEARGKAPPAGLALNPTWPPACL